MLASNGSVASQGGVVEFNDVVFPLRTNWTVQKYSATSGTFSKTSPSSAIYATAYDSTFSAYSIVREAITITNIRFSPSEKRLYYRIAKSYSIESKWNYIATSVSRSFAIFATALRAGVPTNLGPGDNIFSNTRTLPTDNSTFYETISASASDKVINLSGLQVGEIPTALHIWGYTQIPGYNDYFSAETAKISLVMK